MNPTRTLIPLLLIFSTLLLLSTPTAGGLLNLCPKLEPSDPEVDQYIVIYKPPSLLGGILEGLIGLIDLLIECLGYTIKELVPGDDLFGDKKEIIDCSYPGRKIFVGFFNKTVANILDLRPDIELIEKVKKVEADFVIPPHIINKRNLKKRAIQTSAPYNLDRIDQRTFPLDGKYSYPDIAGSGVNVYVVDTGIDINNVEFEGRASHGGTFCNNCSNTDDHGHGTNVAGIIGGKKFGVAKKTKLIAIKVLNQNGQGTTATVAAGLSFVISKHKNSSNKNTIINLSMSSSFSDAFNKIVTDCTNAGIHVVASAGDKGLDACDFSPSTVPQVITVGATEKTSNNVASFSNTGECVSLYAPGRDVVAAGASDDDNALSMASGTSQSCPHVTGAVALFISKSGNRSPSSMQSAIVSLASKDVLSDNSEPNNAFVRVPAP